MRAADARDAQRHGRLGQQALVLLRPCSTGVNLLKHINPKPYDPDPWHPQPLIKGVKGVKGP